MHTIVHTEAGVLNLQLYICLRKCLEARSTQTRMSSDAINPKDLWPRFFVSPFHWCVTIMENEVIEKICVGHLVAVTV